MMNKMTVIMCGLLLCVLSGCESGQEMIFRQEQAEGEEAQSGASLQQEEWLIYVHICGAVKDPGVVVLQEGSRVFDAVEAAGGLTEQADESYVNLAAVALDGAKIYIPTKTESASGNFASGQEARININTADAALLCTLPGIGEGRAEEIIRYRQQNGPFQKPEQIMAVEGIKQSVYDKIKNLISVDG